jgi:hypothetical protein
MWRNRENLEKIGIGKERISMMGGVFSKKFNITHNVETFCTMMNTIKFCGIRFEPKLPKVESTENLGETANVSESDILLTPAVMDGLAEDVALVAKDAPIVDLHNDDDTTAAVAPSPPTRSPPKLRLKFPSLNELYRKLFDTPLPTDMHNSMIDVLVCLRCFLKVRLAKDMTENEFLDLVAKYSR